MTPDVQADVARIDALWNDCRATHGHGGDYLFGAWCAADAMYAPVVTGFGPTASSFRQAHAGMPMPCGSGPRSQRSSRKLR